MIEEKFLNISLAARKGITVNTSGLIDQCEKKKSKNKFERFEGGVSSTWSLQTTDNRVFSPK